MSSRHCPLINAPCREDCQWWNKYAEACIIQGIHQSLFEILAELEHISKATD